MTNADRLEALTIIGCQILSMTDSGPVDMDRARYCTAGRFSDDDLRSAIQMLHAAGLVNYRGGKYHAA